MLKIFTVLSLVLLTSCRENESTDRNNKEPKALQEKSIDLGSLRSGNNLVDDLYQELVNKSPELKVLENELDELNTRDTTDIFYDYDQKSDAYYGSANNYINTINDSVMKQKILNLLHKNQEKYVSRKAELENLIKTIHKKRIEIKDYHNALKIVLTLPLIEEYQKQHLPSKSPFEKMIEKENQLLLKTKKNTPKY
ncbi:hypothetical protein [Flavobacterium sp. FlaQc-50]|uniref:hypothetical protein n=1 Tax=unclassified Flavobacterium TaxID=196869 RepID=UPI003757D942